MGTVTRGDGGVAGETGQRQLGQYAVLPLPQGLPRWAVFRFASCPSVHFISFRCVGRLARPRYLPGGRASAPFSFGISFKEYPGPLDHAFAMIVGEGRRWAELLFGQVSKQVCQLKELAVPGVHAEGLINDFRLQI